jgi:chromosome segregation ATPase
MKRSELEYGWSNVKTHTNRFNNPLLLIAIIMAILILTYSFRVKSGDEIVADLRNVNIDLSARVSTTEKERDVYKKKLDSLSAQVTKLEDRLDDIHGKNTTLEKSNIVLAEKLGKVRAELLGYEAKASEDFDKISKLKGEIATLNKSVSDLEYCITTYSSEKRRLEKVIARLQKLLEPRKSSPQ